MSRREYQSFKSSTTLNVCHPESPRFASRAEGSQSSRLSRASLMLPWVGRCAIPNSCHPERSLATSEANRQTKSKDLLFAACASGAAGSSLKTLSSSKTNSLCHPESPRFASRAEGSQSPQRSRVSLTPSWVGPCAVHNPSHPERSLAIREAHRYLTE